MAVMRVDSIHGAAGQLNVALSVVSRQIADLAHGLGLLLFERTARALNRPIVVR